MARRAKLRSVAAKQDWQRHSSDPNFVTALARGLEILRAFSIEDRYLGNGELAERTGIPKPTVSRLTQTLTTLGYLGYVEPLGKYQLGTAVLALGYRFLASCGVRDLARPYMQALADEADCAVALGTVDRLSMTYTAVCQGSGPLILRLEAGARLPMALTAMGRAYLAVLPEGQREELLGELAASNPAAWPEWRRGIERALRDYERHGFCFSEGAWHREISAVGVPLVLDGGREVFAFNCGGSSLRLTRPVLEENLGPQLLEIARRIELELSGVTKRAV